MSHRIARMRSARIASLALWALASLGLWALAASPSVAEPVRVAILPVVVHSASPDPSYVSRGISDMLSARLEQLGGVEILQIDDPLAATSRLEPALEWGRSSEADYVLYGSFTQFGNGASLDMQCASVEATVDGHDRNIFIQSGNMGDLIPQLDQLADKLVRFVSGVGTSEEAVPTAGVASIDSDLLLELQERLEALERTVFTPAAGVVESEVLVEPELTDLEVADLEAEELEAEGVEAAELEVDELETEDLELVELDPGGPAS